MAGFREFAQSFRRRADRIARAGPEVQRMAALAIDQAVVLGTPVDKGRARSNWQVGLGSAPGGTREAFSPGEGGNTGASNAQAAISAAKEVIAGHTQGDIYLVNNLPYIVPLNNGHSAQAPAGFVELAVQAGFAEADRVAQSRKMTE